MRAFDVLATLFGRRGQKVRAAQRAELQGDLSRAVELWADAGRPDEAARVLIARSDAELDPKTRLIFLGRAIELCPESAPQRDIARKKRALIRVELAKVAALPAALRHDLREAAEELEALGDPETAAEAFRLAGDEDGRARALVAAGAVDELEQVLHDDVATERSSRDLRSGARRIESLIAGGERRAALDACEALLKEHPDSPSLRERRDSLRSARLLAPLLSVRTKGEGPIVYVLGNVVRIGRSEGEIQIPHAALSRSHLRMFRDEAGIPHVADTGSRNGTTLRGVRLGGPLPVTAPLELFLGGEVPVRVEPMNVGNVGEGGIRFEAAGRTYVAPLGAAHVGQGDWELVVESDGWIALRAETSQVYAANLLLGRNTQLLAGDAFTAERDRPVVLQVER